ncbi:MAG: hypothetical protein QNK85_02695 [Crocinitomicaceae bacterium]
MKTLLLTLLLVPMIGFGQPEFEWAGSNGGISSEYIEDINVDFQGNIINVGRFSGIADFDPGIGNTTIQAYGGTSNTYIQKINPDGTLAWVKCLLSSTNQLNTGFSVSSDSQGFIYVTGFFSGIVDFDPNAGINQLYSPDQRPYILKLDPLGNFVWVKLLSETGSFGTGAGYEIVIDNNDDILITGHYTGTLDFDPGPLVSTEMPMGEGEYVLKLNNSGDYLWHKAIQVTPAYPLSIDINNNNEVFICGAFSGTADLEMGAGISMVTAINGADIFIQKLDATGDFQWVKTFGGSGECYPSAIKINSNGEIINIGDFQNTIDLDPGVNTVFKTSNGEYDSYIVKLDGNGDFIWGIGQGGSDSDAGKSLFTDNLDKIYVTGAFTNTVDFDPGVSTFNLQESGSSIGSWPGSSYVQKLSTNGTFEWAFSFQGEGEGEAIEVDNITNSLYVCGRFYTATDFNPGLGSFSLTPAGTGVLSPDCFIVKLSQCEPSISSISESSCDTYTAPDGQVYLTTGNYTATIPNSAGCDSIITLDLTITAPSTSSVIETACESYTAADGQVYTSTGSYTSTIPNAAGCDSVISIDLTINPLPSNDVTQNGATLTATQTVAAYQWIDCDNDNAPIVGEVNQAFTPTSTGNYAVIVNVNGCSNTSECRLVDFTGIGELNNTPKQLIKIVDVLGRETPFKPNTPLLYIYNDGTVERKVVLK